jgi:hypothetical protein
MPANCLKHGGGGGYGNWEGLKGLKGKEGYIVKCYSKGVSSISFSSVKKDEYKTTL